VVAFLNLSNHLLATWSPAQLTAARALGLGEPVDLHGGMPLVDPRWPAEAIPPLARALADRALAQGARGAHVAGEGTLAYALVNELKRRGVRCFCATTDRQAMETPLPHGGVRKESRFRFVGWREYL
jgi:hypothetical protein